MRNGGGGMRRMNGGVIDDTGRITGKRKKERKKKRKKERKKERRERTE